MALLDELQKSLGSAYTIDRELDGGGMSRVFLATETRLNRNVIGKLRAAVNGMTSCSHTISRPLLTMSSGRMLAFVICLPAISHARNANP